MTPSVSIIVPIHNAESTLRRCVDSILGQTLKDIQIILVNDASDDGSGNFYVVKLARDIKKK